MEFSQQDKERLLTSMLNLCNDRKDLLGSDLLVMKEFKTQIFAGKKSIEDLILNRNNSYFLKEESSRIVVFYSFLKTLGSKRTNELDQLLYAKNAGLKLGLNSIGTSQVIHKFRNSKDKEVNLNEVLSAFSLYQN